jgi:hypothetical protein
VPNTAPHKPLLKDTRRCCLGRCSRWDKCFRRRRSAHRSGPWACKVRSTGAFRQYIGRKKVLRYWDLPGPGLLGFRLRAPGCRGSDRVCLPPRVRPHRQARAASALGPKGAVGVESCSSSGGHVRRSHYHDGSAANRSSKVCLAGRIERQSVKTCVAIGKRDTHPKIWRCWQNQAVGSGAYCKLCTKSQISWPPVGGQPWVLPS